MKRHKEIDLSKIKTYSINERHSKVETGFFAKAGKVDLQPFLDSLPDILSAQELRKLILKLKEAKARGKAIIIGLGGHVIKCGLAPLIIELMESGYVSAIAVNGSVIIHDFELANFGHTSEDVSAALKDGSFGMAQETARDLNSYIIYGYENRLGLGQAVGQKILENAPYSELSLLAMAAKYEIPLSVHVALGTDIIHQSPHANGAAIGDTSHRDFRIFCHNVCGLNDGGVYLNLGSAVILPEVFLKALTVARNIQPPVKDFSTAVFDMNMHYRARVNVVQRPVESGGEGFYFLGQHELLIPLLVKSLL